MRITRCKHPGCNGPANASGYCPMKHDPAAVAARHRARHGIGTDANRQRDTLRMRAWRARRRGEAQA